MSIRCTFLRQLHLAFATVLLALHANLVHADPTPALQSPQLTVSLDNLGQIQVLDKRTGRTWRQMPASPGASQRLVKHDPAGGTFTFEADLPGVDRQGQSKPAPFRIAVALANADLSFTFTSTGQGQWRTAAYPFIFAPPGNDPLLVYPHAEGLLVPARKDHPDFLPLPASSRHGGGVYSGIAAYLACLGQVDAALPDGLLTIFDTPELLGYQWAELKLPAGPLIAPQLVISSNKYAFDRSQRAILSFSDRGGYVTLAQRYRKYLADLGRYKPLRKKIAELPSMQAGAPVFWVHGNPTEILAVAQGLKALGIDRAVFNIQHPRIVAGDLDAAPGLAAAVAKLGFVSSRYDQYRDCFEKNPRELGYRQINSDAYPDAAVRRENGQILAAFGPASGVINPERALDLARKHIPEDLQRNAYTARFLDCLGSVSLSEGIDWTPSRPCDVYRTRRAREDLLAYVATLGQPVGTECGVDYLLPNLCWLEGCMTLVGFSCPPIGDGPNPPPARYDINISPKYRIPFYSLVHHDEVVNTWRWEDGMSKVPESWHQKNLWSALYGNPPMYFLSRKSFDLAAPDIARTQRYLAPWLARIALDALVDHRFLTPDRNVQETRFSSGVGIVVNFSRTDFRLPDNQLVPARNYLTFTDTHPRVYTPAPDQKVSEPPAR